MKIKKIRDYRERYKEILKNLTELMIQSKTKYTSQFVKNALILYVDALNEFPVHRILTNEFLIN